MDPEDIASCQFVPLSALEKAVEFSEAIQPARTKVNCMKNLYNMQKFAIASAQSMRYSFLKSNFQKAVSRAIYAHDWNKLLYLLKKSPIWEQTSRKVHGIMFYVRALTILFMYHPSAQTQKLLDEYIHMVCSCRREEEKKALMKLILTLPEKFVERYLYLYQMKHRKYRDDNY